MGGTGIFDIIAIVGNNYIRFFIPDDEVTSNIKTIGALILFLRFIHIQAMLYPITFYLKHYTTNNRKR